MPNLYLGQWEWVVDRSDFNYWRAPGGDALGNLDLRSIPQMDEGPTPQGYGLFIYDGPRAYPELVLDLGSDIEAGTSLIQRSGIETLLAKRVASTTLLDTVSELLLAHADPTGQAGWKPLRGGRKTGVQLYLGGYGRVLNEKLAESHPAFQQTLDVFQADYRRNFAAGIDETTLRKWTGNEQIKLYGRQDSSFDDIIPIEYRLVGSEKPTTTVTDDFNRADGPGLGANWTQEESKDFSIGASTYAQGGGPDSLNTHNTSLSSDGHYSQADLTVSPTNNITVGLVNRFTSTTSFYLVLVRQNTGGDEEQQFYIKEASFTLLSELTTDGEWTAGDTGYYEVTEGDSHTWKREGVTKIGPTTNSTLTGALVVGMRTNSGANGEKFDNFEAGDLAAGGAAIPPQELGISISIRIGMLMLAALMSIAALIQMLERIDSI